MVNRRRSPSEHKSKTDLWKGCFEKDIGNGAIVQMDGIGSVSHTVFSRMLPVTTTTTTTTTRKSKVASTKASSLVDAQEKKEEREEETPAPALAPEKEEEEEEKKEEKVEEGGGATIGQVVDAIVGEGWKQVAKEILEKKQHIEKDAYPSARELLKLGAVWLLNETEYTNGGSAHAHRLMEKDEGRVPKWEDMTLRVHYAPERFHAAFEVDWGKYCRGLLIGGSVEARVAGQVPHVPLTGLPDSKDGVVVYEDLDLGFAVINKPGSVPMYATIDNHLEDVITSFSKALKERHGDCFAKKYASAPFRIDTETSGLVVLATRKECCSYLSKLVENKTADDDKGVVNTNITRKFRCLVCVKNTDSMDQIEKFQQSGTVITHYCCPQSPAPKRFYRQKPHANGTKATNGRSFLPCKMRITKVGDDHFRAACVSSRYGDSVDSNLAHRLWGLQSDHPADDLHTKYVMELEVELLSSRPHQLRGQLAAMGLPIVGDHLYGGGKCEYRSHMHGWNRMAIQCSELSFLEPQWVETPESSNASTPIKKDSPPDSPTTKGVSVSKKMEASDRRCHFRINNAWWSEYLQQYEMYHQSY